jgi:hypothetical protein
MERVNDTWLNAEEVAWSKLMLGSVGLDLKDPFENVERLMVVLRVGRHAVTLGNPSLPEQEGVAVVLRLVFEADGVSQQSKVAAAVGGEMFDLGDG